jgi:hypothetical protein
LSLPGISRAELESGKEGGDSEGGQIAALRGELRKEIDSLKAQMKEQNQSIDQKLDKLFSKLAGGTNSRGGGGVSSFVSSKPTSFQVMQVSGAGSDEIRSSNSDANAARGRKDRAPPVGPPSSIAAQAHSGI